MLAEAVSLVLEGEESLDVISKVVSYEQDVIVSSCGTVSCKNAGSDHVQRPLWSGSSPDHTHNKSLVHHCAFFFL